MKNTLQKLNDITAGCREDMHEPDEQDIKAYVIGDHLDNAFGNSITLNDGFQEFVVVIRRNEKTEKFNLATLIALARKANL